MLWWILGAGIVAGGLVIWYVRRKLRQFSRAAFGTPSLIQGLTQAEELAEREPKSLSGADVVYMPAILADFPEFNRHMAAATVEAFLADYLQGWPRGGDFAWSCSETLMGRLKAQPLEENITAVKIHGTVVNRYIKSGYDRTIVFQTALEYKGQGKVCQKRYDTFYTFTYAGETVSLRCEHCGGPITDMGAKICPYCGSMAAPAQDKTWMITDLKET